MKTESAVVLLSGGLDSASLLLWALEQGWQLLPLYVDYGQVARPGEWGLYRRCCQRLAFHR